MINTIKVRFGFSIKNQISFLLALTELREKQPTLDLHSAVIILDDDFPYLAGVINNRIEGGLSPIDAISETLDDSLVPYVQNDELFLSATSGICRILLAHHSMFVRRVAVSFVFGSMSLAGILLKEPSLAIGSAALMLVIDYLSKPITELHKAQKII